MSLSEEHRRIYEAWHRAIVGQNLDDLMALYAEDGAIDSTAVLVLERDPSGILRGKDRLRAHFQAFFDLIGPGDGEWHRLSAAASSGGTLIWEYPSAGPRGEQLDVVESFDIRDGLITYHRVYWGRVGFRLLADAMAANGRGPASRPSEEWSDEGMVPTTTFLLEDPTPQDPRRRWHGLGQAARDACYDNAAAVPDSAARVAARNAASKAYRAAHGRSLDIAYASRKRTLLDLYPALDTAAPCLVFVHGGYWQFNSQADFACFAEGPSEAGWSVAMPGYTLAPETSLAGIAVEIGAALNWLAEHGPAHGIGGPIVLAGWSAGAQLAALHLGHPAVAAGLAISGVYDLAPIRETYLDAKLRLTDEEIAFLSPLRLPVAAKPMTLAYGSRELPALVHDARNLHALRAAANAPGTLLPVAGADHFSILDEFRRPGGMLVRAANALLGEIA